MPQYQHIREICARLVTANNDEQVRATFTELKIALHDHQAGSPDDREKSDPHPAISTQPEVPRSKN